jgi:pilus assembly protein CpaE
MHDWTLSNELMAKVLADKGYHYQFLFARNAASEGARTVGVMPYGPDAVTLATRDATDELVGPWGRDAHVTVNPNSVVVRIGAPVVIPGVSLSSTVSVPVQRDDA